MKNKMKSEAESKMENGNKETRKRPLEDQSEMSMKRKKTLILSPVTLATKSPVAILNEVKQGLTYQLISQSGPTHAPLFAYSVDIDGEKFIGEGKNKKLAKAAAARNALQSFIQFPKNNSMVNISTINDNVDFTSDDIVQEKPKNGVSNIVQSPKIPAVVAKGPVMILNEMFPGLTYECESLNDSVAKFKMSVEVKGELFFGTGGSKKHAKAAAARAALSKICNMSPSTFSMPNVNSSPSGLMHKRTIPQMLVDYIGELVLQKFDSLTRDNTTIQKRKVIAGIVMTENYSLESAKLICVTTGTKCISGDHISVQGAAINDTHAEIVARRCLIDFLYTQLENLSSFGTSSKETIFKPRDDNSNGYTLKEGIKFHLYINTAPCGDARIFSPHEIEDKGLLDKHPNRKARGQLRTKIESGEGTIPVASSGGIQTWDGVLQGERLLTMSCSDKICRWNVLGVQGALLTNFIDPIYLDSIILGSLLHPEHMCRAIYGRIETTIQALPPPFKLNKPETNLLSSSETRRAAKAPNFSVNWTVGLPEAEVINSMTGKTEYGGMSRICKQMFFRRFLNLVGNIKSLTKFPENEVITMYSQAKQLAGDYQTAKKQLYMAFEKAYLGAWLKKPIEQDQFEL